MPKIDPCTVDWIPMECRRNFGLVTFLSDTHLSAADCQEWSVHQLYCIQGTPKLLHPKPKMPARSAWATSGSVRTTTTKPAQFVQTKPAQFVQTKQTRSGSRDTNNSTSVDTNFRSSPCVTKLAVKQAVINKVQECQLSTLNCSTEVSSERKTIADSDKILNDPSKPNQNVANSDSVPKHIGNLETKQPMRVVELFPGVTSYIIDVGPKVQNGGNYSADDKENESKLETQLFSTLEDCPNASNDSDDETALTWYKKVVEREVELYLHKVHKNVSEGCDQNVETSRQAPSSRQKPQNPLLSKTAEIGQTQETTQSHRIDRTARYVRYLQWKENMGRSKDRLDLSRNKPPGNL